MCADLIILGSTTGTGVWAIDFANQHPKSEVLGIDLQPVEPGTPVPPNCRFEVADADEPWTFAQGHKYDYIHIRSLGLVLDYQALFKAIFDHLTLDGFVEFQEWSLKMESADHSLEGTELCKWNQLVMKGKCAIVPSLFLSRIPTTRVLTCLQRPGI